MRGKLLLLLLSLLLMISTVNAEISWPEELTPAQGKLQTYIEAVNDQLTQHGAAPVNQLFELYSGFASLAVTGTDNAEIPEGIEISVTMDESTLCVLTLRINDADRFVTLAASCIQAACPSMSYQDAQTDPAKYAARIKQSPGDSFKDSIFTQKGTSVRTYYEYAPNEYHDGVNWITMTLIFPLEGYEENGVYVTYTPAPNNGPGSDDSDEYEGYVVDDGYTHFEIITTETPNPDDALIW